MIGIGVVALHSFYYDNYLLRAAITKLGFGANIAREVSILRHLPIAKEKPFARY
jgi:hypothetical protein